MLQRTKEENHNLDQMNFKADSVFMLIHKKKRKKEKNIVKQQSTEQFTKAKSLQRRM